MVVVVPSAEDEDEDETAMRLCKAWHRRRLQDRWKCKDQGHSHCFKDTTSPIIHIQLTEADLDDWVDRMVIFFHIHLQIVVLNFMTYTTISMTVSQRS